MERGGVLRNVLRDQDVRVSAVKEFVMEDVRSPEKSSGVRPSSVIVRQFAASRIERQVLAEAFEVVWRVLEDPAPSRASRDNDQHRASTPTRRIAVKCRVTEGVVS